MVALTATRYYEGSSPMEVVPEETGFVGFMGPALLAFVESPESESGREVLAELSALERRMGKDAKVNIIAVCPVEIWVEPEVTGDSDTPVSVMLDDDRLLAVQLDVTYSAQSVDMVLIDAAGTVVQHWTEPRGDGLGDRIMSRVAAADC